MTTEPPARLADLADDEFTNAAHAAAILIRCLTDPETAGDESISEALSEARHYARQCKVWDDDWDWNRVQSILDEADVVAWQGEPSAAAIADEDIESHPIHLNEEQSREFLASGEGDPPDWFAKATANRAAPSEITAAVDDLESAAVSYGGWRHMAEARALSKAREKLLALLGISEAAR